MCKRALDMRLVAEHLRQDNSTWEKLHKAIVDKQVKREYETLQSSFDRMLEQKINELIENYSRDDSLMKENARLDTAKSRNVALNLKCPHSCTVFAEFEGCMALKCSTCHGHFCGFCHSKMKTSAGAHEHVRNCLLNETRNGSYYAHAEEIKQAQRRYRTREEIRKKKKNKMLPSSNFWMT